MSSSLNILRPKKLSFWLPVLLVLMCGFGFVPTTAAQGNDGTILTVVAATLNVRSGPGLTYLVVDSLTEGDTLAVVGHDATSGWWQIQLLDGQTGWVSGGSTYVAITPGLTAGTTTTPLPSTATGVQTTAANRPLSGTIVFQTVSGGPIYAIKADGSNLHYLTTGIDPALSPDGQWVAFTRWDNPQPGALGSLWVIKIDGSGERMVLGFIPQPKSPTWSPDGTQIVLSRQDAGRLNEVEHCGSSNPPGNADRTWVIRKNGEVKTCYTLAPDPHWGLRLVNVATGQFQDLPGSIYAFSPTWDPRNANHLVYAAEEVGLVSLDLSRSINPNQLLTSDVEAHSPSFSPDGSKLAVSYRQDTSHWEIHVLNADGSGQVRLTQTSYEALMQQQLKQEKPHSWNNAAPAWSPDGSQIAFVTDRTGQWEIWVMNADGTNQRPLLSPDKLAGITLQYQGMDERMLSWR